MMKEEFMTHRFLRISRSRLLAGFAVCAVLLGTGAEANAQASGDVIVMRRPIALPKREMTDTPSTPTPIPDSTPTPTPTPVPGNWVTDEWAFTGSDACTGAAPQTRTVRCEVDGETVDIARCAGEAPEERRTVERHDGCTFDWGASEWSDYSSQCSGEAVRTRAATCMRSDGEAADASLCNPANKPQEQETAEVYASCTSSWKTGEFVDPGASCGSETQTRTVTCRRDIDQMIVADNLCDAGSQPSSTQTVSDSSGCTYEWVASAWSAWSSTCGSATRTRTHSCTATQTDDIDATGSHCTSVKPGDEIDSQYIYTGCQADWAMTTYLYYGCGQEFANQRKYQSKPLGCYQNGVKVSDVVCIGAGKPKPATTGNYSVEACTSYRNSINNSVNVTFGAS
jgi:hypothetical protein